MAVALRVYAPRVRALALGAALHDVGKVAMLVGLPHWPPWMWTSSRIVKSCWG